MGFEARLAGKERGDATDAKGLYDHKDKGGIEHGLTDRQGLKTAAKRLRTYRKGMDSMQLTDFFVFFSCLSVEVVCQEKIRFKSKWE